MRKLLLLAIVAAAMFGFSINQASADAVKNEYLFSLTSSVENGNHVNNDAGPHPDWDGIATIKIMNISDEFQNAVKFVFDMDTDYSKNGLNGSKIKDWLLVGATEFFGSNEATKDKPSELVYNLGDFDPAKIEPKSDPISSISTTLKFDNGKTWEDFAKFITSEAGEAFFMTVHIQELGENGDSFNSAKFTLDSKWGGRSTTPEPATMLILGLGLAGLPVVRRFRKNS